MNGKQAKKLRRLAKSIYDAPVSYNDTTYKVDVQANPEMGYFDGALAKRVMQDGCTRKMYKDLKKGYRAS